MSTTGLRKTGNFEAALAQAIQDETHVEGIISPYMQNFATMAINNPEFQRVQDRLEENLAEQTKAHLESYFRWAPKTFFFKFTPGVL